MGGVSYSKMIFVLMQTVLPREDGARNGVGSGDFSPS